MGKISSYPAYRKEFLLMPFFQVLGFLTGSGPFYLHQVYHSLSLSSPCLSIHPCLHTNPGLAYNNNSGSTDAPAEARCVSADPMPTTD